jgi:hypothetical protein
MSVSRRGVLRVLGVSAVARAAGGFAISQADQMPAVAVEGWKGPSPALKDPRLRALSHALLAPNPHNMQAWIADLREPDTITFFCDPARLLPQTDPFSRQIVIGCGCFLEILRLAAAQEGYPPRKKASVSTRSISRTAPGPRTKSGTRRSRA